MAKLYVICGHGNGDPGAIGGGYREADLVRKLAAKMNELNDKDVYVLDTTRNWYADKGLSRLSVPDGARVIELHMDSASASARGGHVIISSAMQADKYDKALAKFVSGYFPGRSIVISRRGDLQNVNIAAQRGINYRLVEVCFISNAADRKKFLANLTAVAKGILQAMGVSVKETANKPAQGATATQKAALPYRVKVTAALLNVRKGAGTKYARVRTGGKALQLKRGEVYTITAEKTVSGAKWGKLKSGAGWIHLGYTAKV